MLLGVQQLLLLMIHIRFIIISSNTTNINATNQQPHTNRTPNHSSTGAMPIKPIASFLRDIIKPYKGGENDPPEFTVGIASVDSRQFSHRYPAQLLQNKALILHIVSEHESEWRTAQEFQANEELLDQQQQVLAQTSMSSAPVGGSLILVQSLKG